ncbi:MAG TPA: SusD/RagB family nutrient-binding outer membrane lipoprotein, partial [Pedobacter sp.]
MKKIFLTLFVCITLLQTGCKKFSEFQTDPNKSTTATPDLLLNTIEQQAFQSSNLNVALASREMIVSDGVSTYQYYNWTRESYGDYDNLRQVLKMEQASAAQSKPEYQPVAKFFRAWYFLRLTQLFGDIPYSEALKGESGNNMPAYDDQKSIYLSILDDLKAANGLISNTTPAVQGDIVYNGNMQQWKRAINSLSLRVLISLSVHEGD